MKIDFTWQFPITEIKKILLPDKLKKWGFRHKPELSLGLIQKKMIKKSSTSGLENQIN
jgi:hypothetical protein